MTIIPHRLALARLIRIMWNYGIRKRSRVGYPPYRIWIEPTNRCNLACVMCPNHAFPDSEHGFMDFDFYRSLIDQIAPVIHDINLHHRGEPTLHPRLADMIRYADERGVKVKLHTNGTTMTQALSKSLIESGLRLISFSFDGYEAGAYEKIRVRANFDITLRNIHQFLELKRNLGKKNPKTVMEIMELADVPVDPLVKRRFIDELKSRGLDRLIVKKPHNWAGNVELDTCESTSFSPCTFPWHALVVLWDGRVGSCPHDFFGKIIYGDACEAPLLSLFNSPKIVALRSQMLQADLNALEFPCRNCDSVRRKRALGIPLASLKYLRD